MLGTVGSFDHGYGQFVAFGQVVALDESIPRFRACFVLCLSLNVHRGQTFESAGEQCHSGFSPFPLILSIIYHINHILSSFHTAFVLFFR